MRRCAPLGSLLIVGTADILRAPFAASLLRARLPALRIASRGVLIDGCPCIDTAIRPAASFGVALATHRSRRLLEADLSAAGLVIAMERAMLASLWAARPWLRERSVLLGDFDPVEGGDIDDPLGLPERFLEFAFSRIDRACGRFASIFEATHSNLCASLESPCTFRSSQ